MPPTEDDWDAAIKEYEATGRDDNTVQDILDKYGIARPSFYLRIRRMGIAPRRKKGSIPPTIDVRAVLEQLRMAQREIGRLEAEIERLRAQLDGAATPT